MLFVFAMAMFVAAPQQQRVDAAVRLAELIDRKHFGQAVELLETLSRSDPAAAYAAVRDGLRKYPKSVSLLKAEAMLLLRDRRRSAQARDPLAKAVQLAPKDAEAHYYYSQWACLHNQEELCVREAEKALALDPGNLMAGLQLHTLIGIAADKLDRPEQAEAAFRRSIEHNRKLGFPDPRAAHRYVDFLVKRAREEEAQSVADEILRAVPRFGPACLDRAKFRAGKGEHKEAIELAEKALLMDGMDKDNLRAAHVLLARAYFLLGREAEAARHQAWIEENPH
jgi:tetratricopeptide (TPR) repeat protein